MVGFRGNGFQNSIMQKYSSMGIRSGFKAITPIASRYMLIGSSLGLFHSLLYNKVFHEMSTRNRVYLTNSVFLFISVGIFYQSFYTHLIVQFFGLFVSSSMDNLQIKQFNQRRNEFSSPGLKFGNLSDEEYEKRRFFFN